MRDDPVLTLEPAGLACPRGGFHLDPAEPVPLAVVTHAHADHARPGSQRYVSTKEGLGLLRKRLGPDAAIQALEYGEVAQFGAVKVSLHPAGHVLGSAQVRIETAGQVWVVSGDYKRDPDPTCKPFEVVPCDVFVTEATFGLPVYRWHPQQTLTDLFAWWQHNVQAGRASVLLCYALGKAQRILAELALRTDRPVWVHGAIDQLLPPYLQAGVRMLPTRAVADAPPGQSFAGELILAPPSAAGSPWMRRFAPMETAFASGWMAVRGNRRRGGHDRGFVLSDHADWPDLLRTVRETGARRVYCTHGFGDVLARYLRELGIDARRLEANYGEED